MFNANFRSRIYGIPRSLPWATRDDNDPTPGTSGAAAQPSLDDRGLFVSGPGLRGNNNSNEGVNDLEDTNENHASSLEDTWYAVYRDRGYSPEEAELLAAHAAGVPPRSLRMRMGWFADAEEGSPSDLEQTMWYSFRKRGHSVEESARLARAWVSH